MGSILIFFLLIIVAVLFIGIGLIARLISLFKGSGTDNRKAFNNRNKNNSGNNHHQNPSESTKVFSKDEGEYVDFEEIK